MRILGIVVRGLILANGFLGVNVVQYVVQYIGFLRYLAPVGGTCLNTHKFVA